VSGLSAYQPGLNQELPPRSYQTEQKKDVINRKASLGRLNSGHYESTDG